MSKGQSRRTRSSARTAKAGARFTIDPYFACLIFAGVGLGTLGIAPSPRLVVLWTTLLGLWLAYREGQTIRLRFSFADMGRGALIGLALGLPLLLLAFRVLVKAVPILYVGVEDPSLSSVAGAMVFVSLVLLAPLAEELFFRDILQKERGHWIAAALYAAAGVILFLPTAGGYPLVLTAVSGTSALLGVLYTFLYARYGLTTSVACHAVVNLALLFVPAVLEQLELFTS